MIDLDITAMNPEELIYAYDQSTQLQGQTGCIGHLRGDFGGGQNFYTIWEEHRVQYMSNEFMPEFDKVVNALRAEGGCGLLVSRDRMSKFCQEHPEAGFETSSCTDFGIKLNTLEHTYLLRCHPYKGDYNFYLYAYVSCLLEQHIEKAKSGIRFIAPSYKELFRIPDGDRIQVTLSDGEKRLFTCRFIDEMYLEVGGYPYHICEFAERMEQAGNTLVPMRSSLPGKCFSVLPRSGDLIILAKGESGYTPTSMEIEGKTSREAADFENNVIGVTKAQEAAMLAGAFSGWQTPAADPKNYDENGLFIRPMTRRRNNDERCC